MASWESPKPFEVLVYHVDEEDVVTAWDVGLIFATSEKTAERLVLLERAAELDDFNIEEVTILVRPFS